MVAIKQIYTNYVTHSCVIIVDTVVDILK